MHSLFDALQDSAGWVFSGRLTLPKGYKVFTKLVHPSGFKIEVSMAGMEWLLYVLHSSDDVERDDVERELLLAIPRQAGEVDDQAHIRAALDRSFGPASQAQLRHLEALIWYWALHTQNVGPDTDLLLNPATRTVAQDTGEILALPNSMDPLFETITGVVLVQPTPHRPHGLNMSRHLMPRAATLHEHMQRMQPPSPLAA